MPAKVLWPERDSLYDLMMIRAATGTAAFNSERQNDPLDPNLCEFGPEYFDYDGFYFDDWPTLNGFQCRILSLDPSKGQDSRRVRAMGDKIRMPDYWAYTLYGKTYNPTIYVEALLGRGPTEEIVATGVDLLEHFKPDLFAIETNTFQELFCVLFERQCEERSIPCPTWPVVNQSLPKEVRIRRLGPYLYRHEFRFKRGSAGTTLLIQQLKDFPQASHDDGPDSLEMAQRAAHWFVNGRQG
jgi:predicted phage terminase large subunit-like protein